MRTEGLSNMSVDVDHTTAPVVQLVDFEPAVSGLMIEWLQGVGMTAMTAGSDAEACIGMAAPAPCDLVLLHLPFPRRGGARRVQQLRERGLQAPVLLLSPTLQPGVQADGLLAHELGVQGLVALPVARIALLDAVGRALGRRP